MNLVIQNLMNGLYKLSKLNWNKQFNQQLRRPENAHNGNIIANTELKDLLLEKLLHQKYTTKIVLPRILRELPPAFVLRPILIGISYKLCMQYFPITFRSLSYSGFLIQQLLRFLSLLHQCLLLFPFLLRQAKSQQVKELVYPATVRDHSVRGGVTVLKIGSNALFTIIQLNMTVGIDRS